MIVHDLVSVLIETNESITSIIDNLLLCWFYRKDIIALYVEKNE